MIVGAVGRLDQDAQRTTLDDLFRRAAVRNPDAIALSDPVDRTCFTGGEARQLTYAQADRAIWAVGARLRALGLSGDAVVGLQLPNTVDSVIALLGIWRAGLIAAPLPMLWREVEIIAALSTVGATALITASRFGTTDHCALAARVAAGLFSIRHICAFGENLSDGVMPLDHIYTTEADMTRPPLRDGNPAAHAAVVTFEPTPRGIQPVTRNHLQLIAAGAALQREARLPQDSMLLSATPPASFAGLAVTLLPWLLCGGRLILHQPFDADFFVAQLRAQRCDAVVVPGPLAAAFAEFEDTTALALWRMPERPECEPARNDVDVTAFGEFGLHPALRAADGRRTPLALGAIRPSHGSPEPADLIETRRTARGTLALRGTMVAGFGFGPTASIDENNAGDGFVDTSYPCRIDPDCGSLIITGPQPGMVSIGGYRIATTDVEQVSAMNPFGVATALPHAMLGQRLAGASPENGEVRAELETRGVNSLIVQAFRPRGAAAA